MEPRDTAGLAEQQAENVARELLNTARRGGTEADFRREAALILDRAAAATGLTIAPRDEYRVACGRVDSLYNRLVLEYKKPGVLNPSNRANGAVIQQVKDYLRDVAKRERREASRLAGVATDGFYFIFVRRVGEGWSVDDPMAVNPASTAMFLRLLFSLCTGAALVPENLIEDFGPKTLQAGRAVRALYRALEKTTDPLVGKLFEQWRLFYSEATDYANWAERIESKAEFRSFIRAVGIDARKADPAAVFYAVHTYYALLVKLVAWLAAARFAGGETAPSSLKKLAAKSGDDLKRAFTDLERGGIFREYGIRNFLEGDFFRWYLSAWDSDIENELSKMAQRLAEYDAGTIELAPENARDLLKKLYHGLLPREIRHDLGEYYTPDWLAERLIIQTLGTTDLGNPTKRVLDPSCGSGTFLVLLIKHIKDRATSRNMPGGEVLDLILQNVIGIDLNPLAVIAARANYLLALGDLLKARKTEIDIPVYQADSVLAPSRGTNLFDGGVYPLKTSAAVFPVPAALAQRERIDALANTLDQCVEDKASEAAFLHNLKKNANLDDQEAQAISGDASALYKQICDLHDDGMNGVWARIIKNNFAPLFLEPCHYIVGNPPWVNWENLPDEYRSDTKPLWEKYGLFPHGGMDTILGKGKKDISMLMTYVAVDRYLRRGGKLGFVVSQTLFKTSGAGQGFRRFELADGTTFGPTVVEDMVGLNPFEGATNRTAVLVASKGRAVRYPTSYSFWQKKGGGRGTAIGFDTPYEAVTKEKITYRNWQAEPVDRADLTSPWLTARPRAIRALRRIIGASPYKAHEGSNSGGANGVYWVEVVGNRPDGLVIVSNITEGARRPVATTKAAIEPDILYPLLRGRDVGRWTAVPSAHIVMAQDPRTRRGIGEKEMQKKYPKAHSYLARFQTELRSRAAFRRYFAETDPYWSMFNVSNFTLSNWKVVWREQASSFTAAVIGPSGGRPVVPDHKLMLVDTDSRDEANFLCAALNSSPAKLVVAAYTVQTSISTHVLEYVAVPDYDASKPLHAQLASVGQRAKEAAESADGSRSQKLAAAENELSHCAGKLWGLSDDEMAEIRSSLSDLGL